MWRIAAATIVVVASGVRALESAATAGPKLDAQTLLDALRALPVSERIAILKKLDQEQSGNVALPGQNSLLNDKEMQPELIPPVAEKSVGEKEEKKEEEKKFVPEDMNMHYQGTVITMVHDHFHSPYEGINSLQREEGNRFNASATGTFFFGRKLWEGGEFYLNPEFAGGEGFSGVTGIAGFPNGDITRVGQPPPTIYIARLFLRQTFNLGGEKENVEGGPNQLASTRDEKHLIVTFGKIAATDVFDTNKFSHDPRGQFMNWSLMDNGAWDYPADTRGYSPGLTMEYGQKGWALRYGAFAVVKSANGAEYDYHFDRALSHNLEFQKSYSICSKEGSTALLAYANNAHMGSYRESVQEAAANGSVPNLKSTQAYRTKYGFGLNSEQKIIGDLGAFFRAGWNDGQSESWMFTEIDRTVSLGLSLNGNRWKRPDDSIGLAGVINGISNAHQDFLRAGGHGFIIGDGRLNYSTEKIIDAFYKLSMTKNLFLTLDYQHVEAPAYNHDRGPVNIGGVRFHAEF
ncbi:MAG TPA: carbohydrate porin [Planctomycetota bacterium]|nr:carbohydrate porin [Planctomycetota bacterium]